MTQTLSRVARQVRSKVERHRVHAECRKFALECGHDSILFRLNGAGLGLGAIWLQALYHQHAFKDLGITGTVAIANSPYSESSDYDPFRHFWVWRQEKMSAPLRLIDSSPATRCLTALHSYDSFHEVAKLWADSYELDPALTNEFDEILKDLVGESSYTSVHFRGTDKVSESPMVGMMEPISRAKETLDRLGLRPVLIFTDEPEFARVAQLELGHQALLVPVKFSGQGTAIHLNARQNGPDAAWDAAFAVYAFSKSEVLIKTPSTLSGFAPILNPNLQVIPVGHLRKDFSFFPDRLIHETR